jgi:hypothetical protein
MVAELLQYLQKGSCKLRFVVHLQSTKLHGCLVLSRYLALTLTLEVRASRTQASAPTRACRLLVMYSDCPSLEHVSSRSWLPSLSDAGEAGEVNDKRWPAFPWLPSDSTRSSIDAAADPPLTFPVLVFADLFNAEGLDCNPGCLV